MIHQLARVRRDICITCRITVLSGTSSFSRISSNSAIFFFTLRWSTNKPAIQQNKIARESSFPRRFRTRKTCLSVKVEWRKIEHKVKKKNTATNKSTLKFGFKWSQVMELPQKEYPKVIQVNLGNGNLTFCWLNFSVMTQKLRIIYNLVRKKWRVEKNKHRDTFRFISQR